MFILRVQSLVQVNKKLVWKPNFFCTSIGDDEEYEEERKEKSEAQKRWQAKPIKGSSQTEIDKYGSENTTYKEAGIEGCLKMLLNGIDKKYMNKFEEEVYEKIIRRFEQMHCQKPWQLVFRAKSEKRNGKIA